MAEIQKFISNIYDCAANPELWPDTLSSIRDHVNAAYVMVGITDIAPFLRGELPQTVFKNSPWDVSQLSAVAKYIPSMPGYANLMHAEIDQPWVQMWEIDETAFHATEFYKNWVGPQKLRDCVNVQFFRRPTTVGVVTAASFEDRPLFDKDDAALVTELAPHLRRALAISDMVDRGRLMQTLFRKVLDTLSTAVFVLAQGQRIEFANEAAEVLLKDGGLLKRVNGVLSAARQGPAAVALEEAVSRAARGDAALGLKGIGVPLSSNSGERAAAYVLPINGNDLRGAMGNGFCAVFVAQRGEQLPMTIEVLRTVFDLSQAEARVAALISKGDSTDVIAESLGVSVNTVRTQLKNAFTKTGTNGQVALASCINDLVPPLFTTSK